MHNLHCLIRLCIVVCTIHFVYANRLSDVHRHNLNAPNIQHSEGLKTPISIDTSITIRPLHYLSHKRSSFTVSDDLLLRSVQNAHRLSESDLYLPPSFVEVHFDLPVNAKSQDGNTLRSMASYIARLHRNDRLRSRNWKSETVTQNANAFTTTTRIKKRQLSENCHYRGEVLLINPDSDSNHADRNVGMMSASLCDGELHGTVAIDDRAYQIYPKKSIETTVAKSLEKRASIMSQFDEHTQKLQLSNVETDLPFDIASRRDAWRRISTPIRKMVHPLQRHASAEDGALSLLKSEQSLGEMRVISPSKIEQDRDRPWAAGSYVEVMNARQTKVVASISDRKRIGSSVTTLGSRSPRGMQLEGHIFEEVGSLDDLQKSYLQGLGLEPTSNHTFCGTVDHPQSSLSRNRGISTHTDRVLNLDGEKFLEVHIVSDYARYRQYYSVSLTERTAARLFNIVDMLYSIGDFDPPLRVVVVGQSTFKVEGPVAVTTVSHPEQIIDSFVEYVSQTSLIYSSDARVLLTGYQIPLRILGMAKSATVCSISSAAVIQAQASMSDSFVSSIIAHEIGHILSMKHDDEISEVVDVAGNTIQCPKTGTIMVSSTSSPLREWSECSKAYYRKFLFNDVTTSNCLADFDPNNAWRESDGVCGNGVIEAGESCDCGATDTCDGVDGCCDATTCLLKTGSQYECSSQSPCCTSSCKPATDSRLCRPALHGACDQPEFCDGYSGECPRDRYTVPGAGCELTETIEGVLQSFSGKCYQGGCKAMASLCPVYATKSACNEKDAAEADQTDERMGNELCQAIRCKVTDELPQCEELPDPSEPEKKLLPPDGVSCGDGLQCIAGTCMASASLSDQPIPVNPTKGWNVLLFILLALAVAFVIGGICYFRRRAKKFAQQSEQAQQIAQQDARDNNAQGSLPMSEMNQIQMNRERLRQLRERRQARLELTEEEQIAIAILESQELEEQRQRRMAEQSSAPATQGEQSTHTTEGASQSLPNHSEYVDHEAVSMEFVQPRSDAQTQEDLERDHALAVALSARELNEVSDRRERAERPMRQPDAIASSGSSATIDRRARRQYLEARLRDASRE